MEGKSNNGLSEGEEGPREMNKIPMAEREYYPDVEASVFSNLSYRGVLQVRKGRASSQAEKSQTRTNTFSSDLSKSFSQKSPFRYVLLSCIL